MPVIVYEDAAVADLEPLSLTRPAFDLRCGARTLLERQLRAFRCSPSGSNCTAASGYALPAGTPRTFGERGGLRWRRSCHACECTLAGPCSGPSGRGAR